MSERYDAREGANMPLLTHEQLQCELSYRAAMSMLRRMKENGLITDKEFVTIAPKLAKRFSPVWGQLYQ